MDPWLEHPSIWMGVHNRLVAALGDEITASLPEAYFVDVEERVYWAEPEPHSGRPDLAIMRRANRIREAAAPYNKNGCVMVEVPVPEEVHETYLVIRRPKEDRLICIIEILSPTNKRPGMGRERYLRKRLVVCRGMTHIVEVDLLRAYEAMPTYGPPTPSDYAILVSRGDRRSRGELYPFGVRDPIPKFQLPLDRGDTEPVVDLGATFHGVYERARYHMIADYSRPPVPPLAAKDRAWANRRLREARLR